MCGSRKVVQILVLAQMLFVHVDTGRLGQTGGERKGKHTYY